MNFITHTAFLTLLGLTMSPQGAGTPQPIQPISPAPVPGFDVEAWAKALGNDNLEARMGTYTDLLARARLDADIYAQVEVWAQDKAKPGLAWTAQLMLRELDRATDAPQEQHRTPDFFGHERGGFMDMDSLFGNLDFMDPFGRGFGVPPLPNMPLHPGIPDVSFNGSGLKIELGPDGVKIRVEETIDGQSETKTYEAKSLDELLEQYPELADQVKGLSPFTGWLGSRSPSFAPGHGLQPSLVPGRPSLKQLGIRMVVPENRSQSVPGVDADVGLLVVDVVPGSLADVIGIQPRELVTRIADLTIRSAQDVRTALSGLNLDQRIEVHCVAADGSLNVRAWDPIPKVPTPQPLKEIK